MEIFFQIIRFSIGDKYKTNIRPIFLLLDLIFSLFLSELMEVLKKYIPIFGWIKDYNKSFFKSDVLAGLTVGVMLIPQGMAYALLAGLPPEYGLYAALVPQVVYGILGTSRQLAVGPVAMDSLIVASIVSTLAVSPEHYIELAILLGLMMGVIQLKLGLLRFGFLVNFLSKPVISAFTFAAAIIIGLNQFKHILGVSFDTLNDEGQKISSNRLQDLYIHLVNSFGDTNLVVLFIGIGGVGLILLLKKVSKKIPAALFVVVIGILVAYVFNLTKFDVKIIREIPSGLPEMKFSEFSWSDVKALVPAAYTLALIAFMEAISVAKVLEEKHQNYQIDPNQE